MELEPFNAELIDMFIDMIKNKIFWDEFIIIYRALPLLWCRKNPDYSDDYKKSRAHLYLLTKLQDKSTHYKQSDLIKKLSNLEEIYWTISKHLNMSQESGANKNICAEKLYYFEKLSFLKEGRKGENHVADYKEIEGNPKEKSMSLSEDQIKKCVESTSNIPHNCASFHENTNIQGEDQLQKLGEKLKPNLHVNSDTDNYAKLWASQYKEMKEDQKILARKIIFDVLFHGCMDTLNMSHTVEIQGILQRESAMSKLSLQSPAPSTELPTEPKKINKSVSNFNDNIF